MLIEINSKFLFVYNISTDIKSLKTTYLCQELTKFALGFIFCRPYISVRFLLTTNNQLDALLLMYYFILPLYMSNSTVFIRRSIVLIHRLVCTRVETLIVATIYLQLIQNRYMFRSFSVLQCSHQHCVQPVASDVEVVGYL